MFYLQHSSELQGYFTNTNPSALSREIYFYCSIFRVDGTVPYCWYLRDSSLHCYAKASSRSLSRETACWRS